MQIAEVQPVIYTDAAVVNAQASIDLGNRLHDLVRAARPVILTLGIRRAARVRAGLRPGRTDVPDLPAADLTVDTTSDPSLETVIHAIRASLEASIHSEVAP